MGDTHKVLSVIFRVIELVWSVVILGITARAIELINQANGSPNPRLEYALSMACISTVVSLVLLPPIQYTFYCFPLDFALFILWIVCFALLEDVSSNSPYWPNSYLSNHPLS